LLVLCPETILLTIRSLSFFPFFFPRNQVKKKANVSIGSIGVGATDALFYCVVDISTHQPKFRV
jgi:hypothetical protein